MLVSIYPAQHKHTHTHIPIIPHIKTTTVQNMINQQITFKLATENMKHSISQIHTHTQIHKHKKN